jgi:hypothetical protein
MHLMLRLISIFIISTLMFVVAMGSGVGTHYDSPGYDSEVEPVSYPMQLDHYTTYGELSQLVTDIASDYGKITELYSNRGRTIEDRIIWMMKISDNPGMDEDSEPEVLFVGAHHGNEQIGNEVAIYIIQTLTEGYGRNPRITWLVDNHEIWVVPMLNPDGAEYTFSTEDGWRKNRSPNYISQSTPNPLDPKIYPTSYGTDLNRNYDYEWGDPEGSSVLLQRSSTYAGSEPFSELETRTMRDLILAHNFTAYIDYHSGTELILYPWGFKPDPPPDKVIFDRIGDEFTRMTGFETVQGYELYQTNGDALDWVYSVSRAIAFTVELSNSYRPDEEHTQSIKDTHVKLPLYLTGISGNFETGSQIKIVHNNIGNQTDLGPYTVESFVSGVPTISDLEVKLYYKVNNEPYEIVSMESSEVIPNQFFGEIPTQGPNSVVQYFIAVKNEDVMVCSPDPTDDFEFTIKALPESIPTSDELVAMIIMMIIILGFFWGGFAYAARLALLAERRKLHEYYYGND